MNLHNRRLDRVMYRNPVSPDWYVPVQEWSCPGCKRSCTYKHCPRCPHISCPLAKSFELKNTDNDIFDYKYDIQQKHLCPHCGMYNCQCGCGLRQFSRQVCDKYRRMRQFKMMEERRERMTQFFIFLMIVFFVVIFVTFMNKSN